MARRPLSSAYDSAQSSGILPLLREAKLAQATLRAPAARLRHAGNERAVSLEELEPQLASSAFVVDACRRRACLGRREVTLVRRPVLLALLAALAAAAPDEATREALIARNFDAKRVSESHRARLRVELGRLRRLLDGLAEISATTAGFRLQAEGGVPTLLLLPPSEVTPASCWRCWRAVSLGRRLGIRGRQQSALGAARARDVARGRPRELSGPWALAALGARAANRIRDDIVTRRAQYAGLALAHGQEDQSGAGKTCRDRP